MREVVTGAEQGRAEAKLALAVYAHRLRASIAAMAAAIGGPEAIVFTGGVGEGSAVVRRDAVAGLGFLGIALDRALNDDAAGDADVSAASSEVALLVIEAREDLEIASQVRRILEGGPETPSSGLHNSP
ncbi:MAG: hypothetical protein JST59_29075 [Actinobacteria bacterium]|nr:hypothetical protein [Actinomycetota bacterium]